MRYELVRFSAGHLVLSWAGGVLLVSVPSPSLKSASRRKTSMSWIKHQLSVLRAKYQAIACCQIPFRFLGSVHFPHPVGIVIGDGVHIGRNVYIYQNVTIGLLEKAAKGEVPKYPTLGDEVVVYAGAVIVGGISIGHRSIIGANAVISRDVPSDSIAYGHNQFKARKAGDVRRDPTTNT